MEKKVFICKKCGFVFEIEVVSSEEARDRKIPTHPISCNRCGSYEIEERKKYY